MLDMFEPSIVQGYFPSNISLYLAVKYCNLHWEEPHSLWRAPQCHPLLCITFKDQEITEEKDELCKMEGAIDEPRRFSIQILMLPHRSCQATLNPFILHQAELTAVGQNYLVWEKTHCTHVRHQPSGDHENILHSHWLCFLGSCSSGNYGYPMIHLGPESVERRGFRGTSKTNVITPLQQNSSPMITGHQKCQQPLSGLKNVPSSLVSLTTMLKSAPSSNSVLFVQH